MRTYKLDDFLDWGRVLSELEELKQLGLLGEHQNGLRRILRYRGNWRLREYALEYIRHVQEPKGDLLQEVCAIMCDDDLYPEVRMLAVDTLRHIMLANADLVPLACYRGRTVFDKMKELSGVRMPPILQEKIIRAVEEITARGRCSDGGTTEND